LAELVAGRTTTFAENWLVRNLKGAYWLIDTHDYLKLIGLKLISLHEFFDDGRAVSLNGDFCPAL
jgi:hypothetical protein